MTTTEISRPPWLRPGMTRGRTTCDDPVKRGRGPRAKAGTSDRERERSSQQSAVEMARHNIDATDADHDGNDSDTV
jgi:hypothetical protein